MATKHVRHGGSSAERTIWCPPWRLLADTLPRAPESDYATEGQALHDCMEIMLLGDRDATPESFAGVKMRNVTITAEHVRDKIRPAWDAWETFANENNIEEYDTEVFVSLSEEVGGTVDILAANTDTVFIIDWKFGEGVQVKAEENSQGLHYALCGSRTPMVADLFEGRTKVCIVIIQPNARGAETLRVWNTTFERVRQFEMQYVAAVNNSDGADIADADQYMSGSHCKFCPCEAICPIKTGLVSEAQRFDMDSRYPGTLAQALDVADEMEQWIAAVRRMAHEQMDRGDKVPGYKLVSKRASRVWNDEGAVENWCKRSKKIKGDEAHNSKLKSPAQMEALLKEKGIDFKQLEDYVSAVSSGTTIAHESDRRPEAPALAALQALASRA